MADVIDILKSSGPISLGVLNLRTSESPKDLVFNIEQLEKRGLVSVSGPTEKALQELTPTGWDWSIRLTTIRQRALVSNIGANTRVRTT